ncbi:hypothetical protein G6729_03835 [Polynucleobacter paneuropaeus]|nr:hypothetical protein G6729_03835 [Polynucleobacter paneuropaeus]
MKLLTAFLALALFSSTSLVYAQESDPSQACFAGLNEKPDLQIIRSKVALSNPNNQTLVMINNRSKAKKYEKVAISQWNLDANECFNLGKSYREEHSTPLMVTAANEMHQNFEDAVQKLYIGKLSYGAFAKERAQSLARYNAMLKHNEIMIENNKVIGETVKIKPL